MKRIFSVLLCLCLLLTCGCNAQPVPEETPAPTASPAVQSTPAPTAIPTPTPVPMPEPLSFTFDPLKLPAEHAAVLELGGNTEDWNTLVAALCNRQSYCSLTQPGATNDLLLVFSASPYAAIAEITVQEDLLHIDYTGSASIDALTASVTEIMSEAAYDSSTALETALGLYRAVSSFSFEESSENSLYRMLTEKKGGAKEFAEALQYLLAQADIFSLTAEASAADFPHNWVTAEFDGIMYHLDPVFEHSSTAGRGLSYFGMSDAAHKETGCAERYTVGLLEETHDALCPESLFDGLFTDVTDWQLDPLTHEIALAYGNGPLTAPIPIASLY